MPIVPTLDFSCHFEDDWFGDAWSEPEVVLIQAGLGRNGEYWRHWVPGLAGRYRVLRRDMRGHGGSTAGEAGHQWSPEGMADEIVAFLDALDIDQVHYVGESVGGITGIVLGSRHPERFRTITLVQTPLHLRSVDTLMRGEYPSWSAAIRELGPGGWVTQHMAPDLPQTAWERAQWDRCDTAQLCRLTDTTASIDVTADVARITVPTLILAPTCSHLTPLEDQWFLRTTIPHAEIEIFEGRGHNLYNEEPERCIARLLRFLDQHRRSGT